MNNVLLGGASEDDMIVVKRGDEHSEKRLCALFLEKERQYPIAAISIQISKFGSGQPEYTLECVLREHDATPTINELAPGRATSRIYKHDPEFDFLNAHMGGDETTQGYKTKTLFPGGSAANVAQAMEKLQKDGQISESVAKKILELHSAFDSRFGKSGSASVRTINIQSDSPWTTKALTAATKLLPPGYG